MSSKLTITLLVVFSLIAIALARGAGGGGHGGGGHTGGGHTGGGGGKGGGKGGDHGDGKDGDHGGDHGGNSVTHDKCISGIISSWCCVGLNCNAQHGQQMYNNIHSNCNSNDQKKMSDCFNEAYGNGDGPSGQYCSLKTVTNQNVFHKCYGGLPAWSLSSCCRK